MKLAPYVEADHPALRDLFTDERRFERRFPSLGDQLSQFMLGYDRSVDSARAILAFLDDHFEINEAIKAQILELCEGIIVLMRMLSPIRLNFFGTADSRCYRLP